MEPRLTFLITVLFGLLFFAMLLNIPAPPASTDIDPWIDHIIPLSPARKAAWDRAGLLEGTARAAREKGDWAIAAADYRAETQLPNYLFPSWTWGDLGLMLDRQGKSKEAFAAYSRGCLSPPGSLEVTGPDGAEAVSRFGLMCEDRGLHGEACECYYTSRRYNSLGNTMVVNYTLDPKKTSPTETRMLLNICLGNALEDERFEGESRWNPDPKVNKRAILKAAVWRQGKLSDAMAAFQKAARLAPNDPLPQLYIAEDLRHAGRFAAAGSVLQKAARLPTTNYPENTIALKAAVAKSLQSIPKVLICRQWRHEQL